ncbi:MAG TPA: phosphatase domain-containing protein [Mariniphaga sp.]|nr:phosphatase domain-containing protein [Mariniphaga sp.]
MKILKPVFAKIKKPLRWIKVFLKQKFGWLDKPRIVPYRGYGNERDIFIRGMVIEDKGLAKPGDKQRVWHNLIATIKRFSSDEIPGVKVRAELLGQSSIMETDDLGFFDFHFHFKDKREALLAKEWHTVHFELLDEIVENQPLIYATGEVRVVPLKQERIIVSDIDDTVMVSHATQTFRKLRLMLFKNAHTRSHFSNVDIFYNALAEGKEKNDKNPFFYVSSSEWNLYDLLEDFFTIHKIPKGVFMLRTLTYSIYKFWKSGGGSHEHKYEKIKLLMEFYHGSKFILIGDSGQHDPSIYSRVAMDFPGRVEVIYIRKIRSKSYLENNENLYKKLANVGTIYLEVQETHEAAHHSTKNGFTSIDLLVDI